MSIVFIFQLLVIVVLDVYLSAARSVLNKIHFSRQLQNFPDESKQVNLALSLLQNYTRVDTGLKIIQMLSRFLVVIFSILIVSQGRIPYQSWWFYLSLFGGALALAILEWTFSMIVIRNPEGWMLGLSPGIWTINRLVSPLVAFLFLLSKIWRKLKRD